MKQLDALFHPSSIAVIGASREPKSVGHTLLDNVIRSGFAGAIYPVNPHADTILDRPCFKDIADCPTSPDLAVIIVPAKIVPMVMEACGKKGVKGVIVISSGFSEMGVEGREKELELKAIADRYGMAMVGPNCLGIINPVFPVNASFAMVSARPGPIAFISQSGAICASMIDYANTERIGFSKFVSIGNKADVSELDLLEYLANDPETKVICMYVEQLKDGAGFIRIVKKLADLSTPKPVIILKAGQTDAGSAAARSHTGALSGNARSYRALFEQANVTAVENVEDLLTTAACFAYNRLPAGNRVAIVTNAGGPGIIATDTAVKFGLSLATYTEETKQGLSTVAPGIAHAGNPMDVLGDADAARYRTAMQTIAADPGVDSLVTILTPQSTTEIMETAKEVIELRKITEKPLAVSFMGTTTVESAVALLRDAQIPVFRYPEDGVRTIAHVSRFARNRTAVVDVLPDKSEIGLSAGLQDKLTKREPLTAEEAGTLAQAYGIAVPASFVWQEGSAVDWGKLTGDRFVLKILSPQILHKTDVGGVMLGISKENIEESAKEIVKNVSSKCPEAQILGIQVSEMVDMKDSVEMIVGLVREPGLGPMVMVGAGGVLVELTKDVEFRFLPVGEGNIRESLSRLQISRILAGYRGSPDYDIEPLVRAALSLQQLSVDHPEIIECDINPLVLFPADSGRQAFGLDVRVKLQNA